ncbi:hypothetical protein CEXT_179141 [Caerostris extrusa]|uniref:Uncharacterized protein n=1 Tax=Caerostris extrusa TaxID=172846 RepID=A0AAV4QU71_CAEEX|nr:hypothetical protein CEXT_179141 [Caerostris extrusa]
MGVATKPRAISVQFASGHIVPLMVLLLFSWCEKVKSRDGRGKFSSALFGLFLWKQKQHEKTTSDHHCR